MSSAIFALACLLSLGMVTAAPLTLSNSDFQDSGHNSNPAGWDTVESSGGVYVYGDGIAEGEGASAGTRVLGFHARPGNSVSQTLDNSEVTADSFGRFTVTFDSGWRNTQVGTDLALVFSIENLTDSTTLGSATYTFPEQTVNTNVSYRVIDTGTALDILYDNADPSLTGDTIALRISTSTTVDTFDPTGWIDNVTLTASDRQPAAHWSFDGATVPERLEESYGRGSLDLAESNGASSWSTRSGFGDVLANGFTAPYPSASNQAALDPGSDDFSLCLWVRRTSDDGNAAGLLDALNGTGTGYQWFYQGNGTLRLRLDDDAGQSVNADTDASQLALNTWRHLGVTIDRVAGRARFFIDGAEVAPLGGVDISAVTGAITPNQDLWIGTLNGTSPSRAQLDEVAFFKRLLTPGEIAAIAAGSPILDLYAPVVPLPEVVVSPASGILRDGEMIDLTSDPGSEIRYTLDGSEPDASSPLYTTPFPLAASATVKARVVDGVRLGAVASADYAVIPETSPNVVVIMADDLGFNDLGCYGAVSTYTPRLDALARNGRRFTQFTTAGPGDLASQYALLTGRLARRGAMPATASPSSVALDSREWTAAELFRKGGYETAFVGAWHLGDLGGSKPGGQGFVTFHGLPWGPDLSPSPPRMENDAMVDPTPAAATLLDDLTTRAESFIANHAADPFFLVFQPPSTPSSGASLLGTYGARVEALDAAVGRLLDQLAASGVADETLVLFLSDSGADRNTGTFPTGSNGQQRDGKGTTWEGGVRVPMIASWPGVIPAGDNFAVVWLPDLMPSLAEIVDGYLPGDRPLDGTSRSTALLGVRNRPDDATPVFLERHTGTGYELQALRRGPWKLHLSYLNSDPGNTFSGTAPLLFNLLNDPSERIDRSTSETTLLVTLQQAAAAHEASFSTPVPQLPVARDAILGPLETDLTNAGETTVTYNFTRPADSLDDHYVLQTGNDLTGWTDVAVTPYIAITPGPDETEDVEVTVPLESLAGGAPRFFVRLMALRP